MFRLKHSLIEVNVISTVINSPQANIIVAHILIKMRNLAMFASRRTSYEDLLGRGYERPENVNTDQAFRSTLNDAVLLRNGDVLLMVIGTRAGWGLFMEYMDGDRSRVKSTTIDGRYKRSITASIVDDRAALWTFNDNHNLSVDQFNTHINSAIVSQSNVFTSVEKVENFLKSFKGHELLFEIEDQINYRLKQHLAVELQTQPVRRSGCSIM